MAEYIAEHGLDNKLIGMGIPDRFVEQGTVAELQHECSYDADAIYDTIIKNH